MISLLEIELACLQRSVLFVTVLTLTTRLVWRCSSRDATGQTDPDSSRAIGLRPICFPRRRRRRRPLSSNSKIRMWNIRHVSEVSTGCRSKRREIPYYFNGFDHDAPKALSTLATIAAEFGDYSRQCGQGLTGSRLSLTSIADWLQCRTTYMTSVSVEFSCRCRESQ